MSGIKTTEPLEAQQAETSPPDARDGEPNTGAQTLVCLPALGPATDTASEYGVDEEVAGVLGQAAARIKRRGAKLVLLVVETGHDLREAERLLTKPGESKRGPFKRWVKTEFDFTFRTAELWMNAALFADEHPDLVDHLHATMLYKLAAPKIPEVVKERVIAEIRAKMPPRTIKEVEILIKEAKESEKAITVVEADNADFEFSDDDETDEFAADLAESARASQELQSLLLQHIPSELIADIAQLLIAMHIGDVQKLAGRLGLARTLSNPFGERIEPSA
jgi:hypothetical protein